VTPSVLPGFDPPITRDYYAPVAQKATLAGGLTGEKHRVFTYINGLTRGGDATIKRTNAEIGNALDLHSSSVNRILGQLKTGHPPGVCHPYIEIRGGPRDREITVLYRPRESGRSEPGIARPTARNSMDVARRRARIDFPKSIDPKPFAATPLFEGIEEKYNVNVSSTFGSETTHPHASENPEPIASPVPPEPRPTPIAEGIDTELVGLTADQLRRRIADLAAAAESPNPRVRIDARLGRAAARATLEALETAGEPVPTPKVEAITPKPLVATAPAPRPSILTLAWQLRRTAGPGPVEALARRLSEDLKDPHSVPFYRRIAERVRLGQIKPESIASAHKQARSPTARCPAAIFNSVVNQLE
jgi:hypothetical protein